MLQEAVCRELVSSGEQLHAVDVGANVGAWSVNLLRCWTAVGGSLDDVALWAFEPAPCAEEELRRALERVGCDGIEVLGMAVGAVEGSAGLAVASPTAGTNTLRPIGDDPRDVLPVHVMTLDAFSAKRSLDQLAFVKIDAEGADFDVLQGAARLLQEKAIRWLQFEYNHRWIAGRFYLRDVFELGRPLGYQVGKITSRGIEGYRRWHPELETYREGNYLLWHDQLPAGLALVPWWLPEDQQ